MMITEGSLSANGSHHDPRDHLAGIAGSHQRAALAQTDLGALRARVPERRHRFTVEGHIGALGALYRATAESPVPAWTEGRRRAVRPPLRRSSTLGEVSDPLDLGLFPLDLVLLPGEKAPLHLFEPRYRQLYADCTLEDTPFVVVHGGLTGTAEVGCSARFESLIRRFEDGRLNVIVQGIAPVRLVEETDGRLYFSALVEELEDASATPAPALVDDVLTRFRSLAGLGEGGMPDAPEGVPLSYAVAGAFELPLDAKQRLLESRDEAERLAMVAELLVAVDKEMEHARMAAHRAGTNGKVSTP